MTEVPSEKRQYSSSSCSKAHSATPEIIPIPSIEQQVVLCYKHAGSASYLIAIESRESMTMLEIVSDL